MVIHAKAGSYDVASLVPGLAELRDVAEGGESAVVAVIDAPCDLGHTAFIGSKLDQIGDRADGVPADHGTHIASLIFGQPGGPVIGVAPRATGLSIPVFGEARSCSQDGIASAIAFAVQSGADVINVSAGAASPSGRATRKLEASVADAVRAGALVVAAAGNDGCACLHVPGALPGVLPVGAMAADGSPEPTSNWGSDYQEVGILAIGADVMGAGLSQRIYEASGTSVAASIVTGTIALFVSALRRRGEANPAARVHRVLLETAAPCNIADDFNSDRCLRGILDIDTARARLLGRRRHSMIESETGAGGDPVVTSPGVAPLPVEPPESDVDPIASEVMPSTDCDCTGAPVTPAVHNASQLVYAIGTLHIDFLSEARVASLTQYIGSSVLENANLRDILKERPWLASSVLWVLKIEQTPAYVIAPSGPYAAQGYDVLLRLLHDTHAGAERVSVGGAIGGSLRLRSGQDVPILVPDLRTCASWTTAALVESLSQSHVTADAKPELSDFLERVYNEFHNLGAESRDRALNNVATNAFNAGHAFTDALSRGLRLDEVSVERAAIADPAADVWEVDLLFFDPDNTRRARRVYRSTVNVTDSLPFTTGTIRSWTRR